MLLFVPKVGRPRLHNTPKNQEVVKIVEYIILKNWYKNVVYIILTRQSQEMEV